MELATIALLIVAIAIGYGLGAKKRWNFSVSAFIRSLLNKTYTPKATQIYLRGLNQFLSEQQDKAVDTFLSALVVNNDTVETHFALGSVLRRRGQLERAIRIHQNILDAKGIRPSVLPKAHLELALDYDASGLLDRAELLLKDLVESDESATRTQALRYLVQIYEKEAEWLKAIDAAETLCGGLAPTQQSHWRYLQAHCCCEITEQAVSDEEKSRWISQANKYYPDHPRALFMEAQIQLQAEKLGSAELKLIKLLADGRYLHVAVPSLIRCHSVQGGQEAAAQQLLELFEQHNNIALIPLITRQLLERGEGESMVKFAISALQEHDQFHHYSELLQLTAPQNISGEQLQTLLEKSLLFHFRCDHCGFSGEQWYWCCPACQSWM